MDKKVYDARDVAGCLGINIVNAYEVMKSENFPAFFIGKRILVARSAFDQWLANDAAGASIMSYKKFRREAR